MRIFVMILMLASTLVAEPGAIRFDDSGRVVQVLQDENSAKMAAMGTTPLYAHEVIADPETNKALLAEISRRPNEFLWSSEKRQILRNGVPVATNPPGELSQRLESARTTWQAIRNDATWNTMTAAQKAEALRRIQMLIIRALIKSGALSQEDFE